MRSYRQGPQGPCAQNPLLLCTETRRGDSQALECLSAAFAHYHQRSLGRLPHCHRDQIRPLGLTGWQWSAAGLPGRVDAVVMQAAIILLTHIIAHSYVRLCPSIFSHFVSSFSVLR